MHKAEKLARVKNQPRHCRRVCELVQAVERDGVEDHFRNAHHHDVEEEDHAEAELVLQRSEQPGQGPDGGIF